MDQAIPPGKLDFPTIINNEQVYNCGRNLSGKIATKTNDIITSNNDVQPEINVTNNIIVHNDNLITISISDHKMSALVDTGANLNCLSLDAFNSCPDVVKFSRMRNPKKSLFSVLDLYTKIYHVIIIAVYFHTLWGAIYVVVLTLICPGHALRHS